MKLGLDEIISFEQGVQKRVEVNLKGIEENLLRLMNVLIDKKQYDRMDELERVRKRFDHIAQKTKSIFPSRILREEDKKNLSQTDVVKGMILSDEMIYRDTRVFEKLLPHLEKAVFNENGDEAQIVILNEVGILLSRLDRLVILKEKIKSSTGNLVLDIVSTEFPDIFPNKLKKRVARYLDRNNFEKMELRLGSDRAYQEGAAVMFQDLMDELAAFEEIIIQDCLGDINEHYQPTSGVVERELELIQQTGIDLEAQGERYLQEYDSREKILDEIKQLENDWDVSSDPKQGQKVNDLRGDVAILTRTMQTTLQYISDQMGNVVEKTGEMEKFMKLHSGGDFEALKYKWKMVKDGDLSKKRFVGACLKMLGKKAIGIFGFGKS